MYLFVDKARFALSSMRTPEFWTRAPVVESYRAIALSVEETGPVTLALKVASCVGVMTPAFVVSAAGMVASAPVSEVITVLLADSVAAKLVAPPLIAVWAGAEPE